MRRECRGFQDMLLPDWHAVALHRARCARQRSKASLQDQCPSWDQLDLPRTRPTPVRLHALALRARNSDRIRQSNGGEWHLARAICRARAFGRHAQGSRPCPSCPTICRRGFRRCGGRLLPKSLCWSNIGGTWHIAILSVRSQRPPPLQPSCIVRAGWKGVTYALQARCLSVALPMPLGQEVYLSAAAASHLRHWFLLPLHDLVSSDHSTTHFALSKISIRSFLLQSASCLRKVVAPSPQMSDMADFSGLAHSRHRGNCHSAMAGFTWLTSE